MSIREAHIGPANLSFYCFSAGELDFLLSRLGLPVHEHDPAIVDVQKCLVPPGWVRGMKLSGVYDEDNQLVEGSARVRGGKHPDHEPAMSKLGSAAPDSRPAFYLGRGAQHFGHFLLETLCRGWAWEEYGENRVPVIQTVLPDYARDLYRIISPELENRIQIVSQPTRFSNVRVPHPGFVPWKEAHLAYKRLCVRMAEKVVTLREMTGQPVYLSRSGLNPDKQRMLLGEVRLERLLEREGVRVVRPETLPVAEQIALFNTHKWIIAPQGSACHARLFAARPTNLVVLCGSAVSGTYLLCDRLSDGKAMYVNVLSSPEEPLKRVSDHRPRYTEHVDLDEQRLLGVLKELALVRPSAEFEPPDPDLAYRKKARLRRGTAPLKRRGNTSRMLGLLDAPGKIWRALKFW